MLPDEVSPPIARAVQEVVWALRRFGERGAGLPALPQSEFEVVHTVTSEPGRTVSDVARMLDRQPSNVSTAVRGLVDRGLVRRETDALDRRSVRLWPTDQARADRALIDASWDTALTRVLAVSEPHEVEAMSAAVPVLRRLSAL